MTRNDREASVADMNNYDEEVETEGGRCDECGYWALDWDDAVEHQSVNPTHRWAIERLT